MSAIPPANPYAVTTSSLGLGPGSEVEAIRKKYLSHEASVKSIGLLYMIGGVIGLLLTVFYVGAGVVALAQGTPETLGAGAIMLVVAVFVGGIAVLQIFTARGLSKLEPWARIVATVLSAIGLLGFPIGTLISAYFLYLLQSAKGSMVFSDEYKQVMAQTPHIKYKTSIIVWIFLFLLIGLIVLGIIGAAVSASAR